MCFACSDALPAMTQVSHLIIFTATKAATYMKLARLPQGPTLTFRVDSCLDLRRYTAGLRLRYEVSTNVEQSNKYTTQNDQYEYSLITSPCFVVSETS